MGRSSEWSVSKDPSERVSGPARYQVSHTVYQNGSSSRRSLLGRTSRPFRPQSRSSKPSPSQPIRSRSAAIRLEPSHLRFTPSLQGGVHQTRLLRRDCLASKDTAFALEEPSNNLLRDVPFNIIKSTGRWSSESFTIYLRQHTMIRAPYIQATPVLEPFTPYNMLPVH
jgi:hypothetical protein